MSTIKSGFKWLVQKMKLLHGATASSKNTCSVKIKLVIMSYQIHLAPRMSSLFGGSKQMLRMGLKTLYSFQLLTTLPILSVKETFFKLITTHGKSLKFKGV